MTVRAARSLLPLEACHLAKAIDIIGDRWTLLILRSALFGVRRFDDFQAELEIPRTVLSGRLKTLVENELMARHRYKESGKRSRSEYVLTERGEALRPLLVGLMQWGDTWLAEGEAPPMTFMHADTRQPVHAGFVDGEGREVAPSKMRVALRR